MSCKFQLDNLDIFQLSQINEIQLHRKYSFFPPVHKVSCYYSRNDTYCIVSPAAPMRIIEPHF